MIKIESNTLEDAYKKASESLNCSITDLTIEVVQTPTNGVLGFFKKTAIIVAVKKSKEEITPVVEKEEVKVEPEIQVKEEVKVEPEKLKETIKPVDVKKAVEVEKKDSSHTILNDTIMPTSFVSMQEDDDDELEKDNSLYLADYEEEHEEIETKERSSVILEIASEVQTKINELFDLTCFNIEKINVTAHDDNTLLIEFKGDDAALMIGKEGYRYKALSYMIFNWINSKYQVQLRLEIAEFLKNQEESIIRYIDTVCEVIEIEGRAQTKILDGVLIQIALKELRDRYPDKYVVIRSTRDNLKYIIVNDYHAK